MANDNDRYNNWTNYETWNVALWLDNDQGTQEWVQDLAQSCWEAASPTDVLTRDEAARFALADALKEWHEERVAELSLQGVFADLLNAALESVAWQEIADHYLEDADKDAA